MAAMGRTPEFEKGDVKQRLLEALAGGNTVEAACNYAGVTEAAFYQWTRKGKAALAKIDEGKEPDPIDLKYVKITEEIRKAQASAEIRAVALIQKASLDSWQAAAWWLERHRPKSWGRVYRHEVSGGDTPVEISLEEKRQAVLESLQQLPTARRMRDDHEEERP